MRPLYIVKVRLLSWQGSLSETRCVLRVACCLLPRVLTCSSTWRDSSVSLNLASLIMTLARSPVPRLDGQVPRKPSFSEYLPHKQEEVAMTGGGRVNIVQQLL